MSRQVPHDVLRRMVSPPPPAPEDVPITSSRAVRMAATRAADTTHAMPLTVMGLREEVASLEDMLAMVRPTDMILGLNREDTLAGLAAIDGQLRAALGEVQTIGHVLAAPPEERAPTATDCALATPILRGFFDHLRETTPRTPLEGWGASITIAKRVQDARIAGLILAEGAYRVIRLTIDLHAEGREGELMIALPDHQAPPAATPDPVEDADWATRFKAAVKAAPVRLDAELARFKVPLAVAQSLEVGQVLPLVGCQVTSVKLRARDGRRVASARLGQAAGMRAVRIEAPPAVDGIEDFGLDSGDTGLLGLPGDMSGDGIDLSSDLSDTEQFSTEIGDYAAADPMDMMDSDTPPMMDLDENTMSDEADTNVTLAGTGEDELDWDLAGEDAAAWDGLGGDAES